MTTRFRATIAVGLVALASLSIVASEAHAQTTAAVDLTWSAPAACPTRDAIVADVAKMARAPAGQPPVIARATVVERGSIDASGRTSSVFVVDLAVGGGVRRLEAPRCEAAAEAVAFIIALAIDPGAKPLNAQAESAAAAATTVEGPASSTPTGAPPNAATPAGEEKKPEPAPAAPPPPPEEPEGPPRPFGERHFAIGAGAALDLASMPSTSVGPTGFVGARIGRVQVDAFGGYRPEQTNSVSTATGRVGARIDGFEIGARGTYVLTTGSLAVGPTLGLVLHQLGASAFGADRSASGVARWLGVIAGASAVFELAPPIGIRADLAADVALATPEFVVDNVGPVHKPAGLSGCAALAIEVRFF